MKKILKKIALSITVAALMTGIAGCGNEPEKTIEKDSVAAEDVGTENDATNPVSEADTESGLEIEQDTENTGDKTLVIYFSATGTTKGVAEKIAQVTGSDLYEIVAKDPYSDEDLNYNDNESRATKEQNDQDVRPEYENIEPEGLFDYFSWISDLVGRRATNHGYLC